MTLYSIHTLSMIWGIYLGCPRRLPHSLIEILIPECCLVGSCLFQTITLQVLMAAELWTRADSYHYFPLKSDQIQLNKAKFGVT